MTYPSREEQERAFRRMRAEQRKALYDQISPGAAEPLPLTPAQWRGYMIAATGGALAVLAFFYLPYEGDVIQRYGPQLAGELGFPWFVPLGAIVIVAISLRHVFGRRFAPPDPRSGSFALFLIAFCVTGALFMTLCAYASPPFVVAYGPFQPGYWVTLLGILTADVGAILILRAT